MTELLVYLAVFYPVLAFATGRLTRKWGLKSPALVLAACWLWPVAWLVALIGLPLVAHRRDD